MSSSSSSLIVVGKTTWNTSRILLELINDDEKLQNEEVAVTMTLSNNNDEYKVDRNIVYNRPHIFIFEGLQPDTLYDITVSNCNDGGSVRTYKETITDFRIAAGACDKGPKRRGNTSMFDKLYAQHGIKPFNLVIRHGDQVYADSAFHQCEKIMKKKKLNDDEKNQQCIEAYRKVYRKVWGQADVKRLMSNIPHLMIWDDHEVVNDFGTFAQHKDQKSIEFAIATCARQTCMYIYI